MTQLAIPPATPEHGPTRLINPSGGLSGDARALLDQGLLAPARDFGAREDVRSGGAVHARLQEQISRAYGVDDRSADELAVMRVVRDARNTEDTKTLHAMSRGELPNITDSAAVNWGKTAANKMLDDISGERVKRGPVVGRAAVKGIEVESPRSVARRVPVSRSSSVHVILDILNDH